MKTYTVELQEDPEFPGELILPIPEEIMEEMGWKIGDTLSFVIDGDQVVISKK